MSATDALQPDQFNLSDSDRTLLDVAGRQHKNKRERAGAMADAVGMYPTFKATARMNQLADHPGAASYAPETVAAWREERAKGRARR